MRFNIVRNGEVQKFDVEVAPGMTILDALFLIRDELDGTLAFRYSCRGAVCGSCAMCINGVPRLACRTQVEGLDREVPPSLVDLNDMAPTLSEGVLLAPLPNLRVVRDLVVDMGPFFERYRQVRPFLRESAEMIGDRMDQAKVRELEELTSCVLCACCHSSCPTERESPSLLGPAALAKSMRFHLDPRDHGPDRLEMLDNPDGWSGCRFVGNCDKVCPKGVRPSRAIGRARAEMKARGRR